jgi:hypothetical protein
VALHQLGDVSSVSARVAQDLADPRRSVFTATPQVLLGEVA